MVSKGNHPQMALIQVGTLAQAFTGRACGGCVAPGLDPDIKEMMLDSTVI